MSSLCEECRSGMSYRPLLWRAARNGHAQCVNMLINEGVDVNERPNGEGSPISEAAYKGSEECMELLIKTGADVNIANRQYRTALHNTAMNGHCNCLKLLIQVGADVNHSNSINKATPLMLAAQHGYLNCVQELIEAGAEVDATNKYGHTALMEAARGKNDNCTDCVKFLVNAGADVNRRNHDGQNALLLAGRWRNDCFERIEYLIKQGSSVNGKDSDGYTSLMQAAMNGYDDFLNVAPLSTIDVNAQGHEDGKTVLILAAEGSRSKFVEFALKAGANVNIADAGGYTAVQYATRNGYHVMLQQLIDAGAEVNNANKVQGETSLMEAISRNDPGCVSILIKAGADVNIADNDERTALIYAAVEGNVQCLKLLLEAGADVNKADNDYITAFQHSAREGQLECIKVFLHFYSDKKEKHAVINEALILAALNIDCVEYLIEAGADVNTINATGQAPLHKAVEGDKIVCATLLIQAGADVNKADKFGNTALITAASLGKLQCIKMLLKSGAHVNKSSFGSNALKSYIMKCASPSKDVAMLLYASGEEVTPDAFFKVPKFLHFNKLKMKLKHICRQAIRKHLLNLDPHQHLFDRVPKLGLPPALNKFLLFNVSLEPDEQENDDDSDDDDDDDNKNDADNNVNDELKTKNSQNQCKTQ